MFYFRFWSIYANLNQIFVRKSIFAETVPKQDLRTFKCKMQKYNIDRVILENSSPPHAKSE